MSYVVNYLRPATGATVPTAAQSANVNTVVATFYPNNSGDGQLAITHNLNIPPGDITQGFPIVDRVSINSTQAGLSTFYQVSQNPNYVVFGRAGTTAGVDTQPQVQVNISRPNSIVQ